MNRTKLVLIGSTIVLGLFSVFTFAVSQSVQQKKVAYVIQDRCLQVAGIREENTYRDPEYHTVETAAAYERNEEILLGIDLFVKCVTHDVMFSWYHPVNAYVADAKAARAAISAHDASLYGRLCGEEEPAYDFLKASFEFKTPIDFNDDSKGAAEFLRRDAGTKGLEAELLAVRSEWCEAHRTEKSE